MTTQLQAKVGLPNSCIVKELEVAHAQLIKLYDSHESGSRVSEVSEALLMTIHSLNAKIRCVCHDHHCQYWHMASSKCLCGNHVMCRDIGFELRMLPDDWMRTEEPTPEEIRAAEESFTERDRERRTNEFFIIWKVRTANQVVQLARRIHTLPEDGKTEYTYNSWRDDSETTRQRNFQLTIREVRALANRDSLLHIFVDNAVGCFSCGAIFVNQDKALAHMDRARYFHDPSHSTYKFVMPDSIEETRPLPPDYRPPMPTPPPESQTHEVVLQRIDREVDDTDSEWDSILSHEVGEWQSHGHPDAIGCFKCGAIFSDSIAYSSHAMDEHHLSPVTVMDYRIV